MDNFMDKLAQKFTAQEMIRANAAADAQEMKRLRTQITEYEMCLQEMRKLNLKNKETIDDMQKLAQDSLLSVQAVAAETIKKVNSVNLARDNAELDRQTQELTCRVEELHTVLGNTQTSLTELFRQSDDFLHKENVKVYRNVQAVVVEEVKKQTDVLVERMDSLEKQNTELGRKVVKMKPVMIIIMIAVLLNLTSVGLLIAQIMGLL